MTAAGVDEDVDLGVDWDSDVPCESASNQACPFDESATWRVWLDCPHCPKKKVDLWGQSCYNTVTSGVQMAYCVDAKIRFPFRDAIVRVEKL